MFGAFNIWKNPLLLNPVLSRAQKEIYKAIEKNQKQYNNETIFLKVSLPDGAENPLIYVVCSEDKVYEEMSFHDLMNDPDLQKQLDSIPSFIRKKIDFDKIVNKINRAVRKAIGNEHYAKVTKEQKEAAINVHKKDDHSLVRRNVTLKDLIDADNS